MFIKFNHFFIRTDLEIDKYETRRVKKWDGCHFRISIKTAIMLSVE